MEAEAGDAAELSRRQQGPVQECDVAQVTWLHPSPSRLPPLPRLLNQPDQHFLQASLATRSTPAMASRPSHPAHKVAKPVARYRPGKAPVNEGYQDDSDEEAEVAGDESQQQAGRGATTQIRDLGVGGSTATQLRQRNEAPRRIAGVVVSVGSGPVSMPDSRTVVKSEEPEYDSDEYETDTDDDHDDKKPVVSQLQAPGKADSESEYETDSESDEEEESSEEEEPEPMFKPLFVSKKQREAEALAKSGALKANGLPAAIKAPVQHQGEQDIEAEVERLAAARRLEAQQLASDRIKAEILAKQAEDSKPDLDDTDGLDPEAEFAAWRIRELQRIKRDWEEEEAKEAEEAERVRRAAMTEAERDAEDQARADQGRQEAKEARGKMGFMQKYYHKGAFFQDLDILKKRDYSTERTEGAVNVESLPTMFQVRDFGKKGRSKWTHLGAEDTSKEALSLRSNRRGPAGAGESGASRGAGGVSEGCFHCGAPDHLKRDCPKFAEEKDKQRSIRRREFDRDRDRGWQPSRMGRAAGDDVERWGRGEARRRGDDDDDDDDDEPQVSRTFTHRPRDDYYAAHQREYDREDRPHRSSRPRSRSRSPPPRSPAAPPPRKQPPPALDRWAERQRLEREEEERQKREAGQQPVQMATD